MYKLRYMLFLLALLPVTVLAKSYYSDFSEFSEYDTKLIEPNELTEVEKVTKYRAYKETFKYIKEETDDKTENIKYENQVWIDEKPDIIIDTKKHYKYYEYADDREIIIINNNKTSKVRINYLSHGATSIGSDIYIQPLGEYSFKIPSDVAGSSGINMEALCINNIDISIDIATKTERKNLVNRKVDSTLSMLTFYNSQLGDIYKNEFESDEIQQINGDVIEETLYLTGDILYETKFIEKQDFYLEEETEEFKIDKSDETDFYRFKTRHKLELIDNKITDSKTTIEDLIKTDVEYKIISDINYKKNGTYKVMIVTPFKTIEEQIIVDSKENIVTLVENITKELSVKQKELEIANYIVEKKNQEIKEIVNNSNDEFLAVENEKIKNDLKESELKKTDLSIEKKKKSSVIIGIIIMCLILLIPILKKEKNV